MGDTPVPALGRANQVGLSLLLHRFHGRIGLGFAFFPVYDGQRNLPIFRPGANPHINIDVLVIRQYRPGNQRVETKRKYPEPRDLRNSNVYTSNTASPPLPFPKQGTDRTKLDSV